MSEEQRQRANDVRAFLRGFIRKTKGADPVGQVLTEAILGQMCLMPDDTIEEAIEWGYQGERKAG